jgi:hypothetical protein
VTQLREEIVNLKSLLLAHRDCPVSAAQGIGGASMNIFLEGGHHANPYGMAAPQPNGVPQGIPMMTQGPGSQMQRRFVLESFYPSSRSFIDRNMTSLLDPSRVELRMACDRYEKERK